MASGSGVEEDDHISLKSVLRQVSFEDEEEEYVSMKSFLDQSTSTPPPIPPIPLSRRLPTPLGEDYTDVEETSPLPRTRSSTPPTPNRAQPEAKSRSKSTRSNKKEIKPLDNIRGTKSVPLYESIPALLNNEPVPHKSQSLDDPYSKDKVGLQQVVHFKELIDNNHNNHYMTNGVDKLRQEVTRLERELIVSQKRERELLKRIDQQDEKIDNLEKTMSQLRADFQQVLLTLRSGSPTATQQIGSTFKHPPCDFHMSHFSYYQRSAGSEWYSGPFYTGPQQGYKMCLQVIANGMGTSAGKDVSICVKLMKGEYDNYLTFPFYGDITVQIQNHQGDFKHASRVISFAGPAALYGASHRVLHETPDSGGRAEKGWGIAAFIPHSYIPYNHQRQTEFVRNDILTIRITKITMSRAK